MKVTEPSSFTFDDVRQLRTFAVAGSVRVVGTDRDQTSVEISEIAHGPLHVERHRDGVLVIRHSKRTRWQVLDAVFRPRHQPHVVLSIAVPRRCPVDLWVISAAAIASGLRGSLEVHGGHGGVSLADVSGFIRASSHEGDVTALWSSGNLRLKTHSGTVTLAECAAHTVQVTTHSGAITVDNCAASRGSVSVTSHSGDALLAMPRLADAMVNIRTTNGRIRSQFAEIAPTGPRGARTARGFLGTGGSSLAATTHSGDVSLLRHRSGWHEQRSGGVGDGETAVQGRPIGHGTIPLLLLGVLGERPCHGYGLMQSMEDRFGGMYSPSPGTVAPWLRRMEAAGLASRRREGGRMVYELTEAGRSELERRRADLDRITADVGGSLRGLTDAVDDDVRAAAAELRQELSGGSERDTPAPASLPDSPADPDEDRRHAHGRLLHRMERVCSLLTWSDPSDEGFSRCVETLDRAYDEVESLLAADR